MGFLANLWLAVKRSLYASHVESTPARILVLSLIPYRKRSPTEHAELSNEFARDALFIHPRFSSDEVRAALLDGMRHSEDPTVIEACMEQLKLQYHHWNRANIGTAMLDVLERLQEPKLNEFMWLHVEKYFERFTGSLPKDQAAAISAQCVRLTKRYPTNKTVLDQINNHVISLIRD